MKPIAILARETMRNLCENLAISVCKNNSFRGNMLRGVGVLYFLSTFWRIYKCMLYSPPAPSITRCYWLLSLHILAEHPTIHVIKHIFKKNQDLSLCHYPMGCLVYIWLGEPWRTNQLPPLSTTVPGASPASGLGSRLGCMKRPYLALVTSQSCPSPEAPRQFDAVFLRHRTNFRDLMGISWRYHG